MECAESWSTWCSAHTEADLAVPMQVARDELNEGQQALGLDLFGTEETSVPP